MNSSQLLNKMPGLVRLVDPDIVICLIGVNDSWNLSDSGIGRFYGSQSVSRFIIRARVLLFKLKTYKLFKAWRFFYLRNKGAFVDNRNAFNKHKQIADWKDTGQDICKDLISHNMENIIQILKDKNIVFIGLTYHQDKEEYLNAFLTKIYSDNDVSSIDLIDEFTMAGQKRHETLYSNDGFHLNKEGYKVFAEIIFPKILVHVESILNKKEKVNNK